MDEKKGVIKEFFRLVTTSFTCFVLAMSLAGWLSGDDEPIIVGIFGLGNEGLPYRIIFALILFSVINSGLSLLITTIFRKIMVLWQLIINLFACLTVNSIVIAVFRIIPLDSLDAWLWFVGSFVVMFFIIAAFMIIKTMLDDRRLEKQLSDYKAKQKNKEENL